MRQIKFKGKCQRGYDYSNGDGWVYGSLLQKNNSVAIVRTDDIDLSPQNDDGYSQINDFGYIPIVESTVSQFTGLADKNGKEIYEGDIVKVHIERADFVTVVTWGKNSRGWKLKCDRTNIDRWGTIKYYSLPSSDRIEIIGNIHDNPEDINYISKRIE